MPSQLGDTEGWLREEHAKQKGLESHNDPVLLSASIEARIEDLRKPFNRLKNKKKPKPPPSPKVGNSTADESAAGSPEVKDGQVPEDEDLEDDPLKSGQEDVQGKGISLYYVYSPRDTSDHATEPSI